MNHLRSGIHSPVPRSLQFVRIFVALGNAQHSSQPRIPSKPPWPAPHPPWSPHDGLPVLPPPSRVEKNPPLLRNLRTSRRSQLHPGFGRRKHARHSPLSFLPTQPNKTHIHTPQGRMTSKHHSRPSRRMGTAGWEWTWFQENKINWKPWSEGNTRACQREQ